MSFSYVPLKPVVVQDPVLLIDNTTAYAVLQSGSKVSQKTYTSTSISQSSIQFSCPPPAGGIIVDRKVEITLPVRITLNGVITASNAGFVPNSTLLNAGKDAPRAFPISGSLDTLRVGINNDSVSINMSDIIHPLTRYNIDNELRAREYSTTPCFPDTSYNYNDTFGTNMNPLGPYGNALPGVVIPRGGFPFTLVSNPVVTPTTGGVAVTVVIDAVFHENLFLSPFFWGKSEYDNQGFFNVNALDLDFVFLSNAWARMWSRNNLIAASGANTVIGVVNSGSVQFSNFATPFSYPLNQPQMLFTYITPNILAKQSLSPTKPIPYPYFEVNRFITDISTNAYNVPNTVYSNNIQLNQIPRRMYIFARPNNQTLQSRCDLTDCYLAISNVSIQFQNNNTVLSTASKKQLYDLSVKNHCAMSWNEWSGDLVQNSAFLGNADALPYGTVGSVLCLEFGTDVEIDQDQAPGLSGQVQILVQATLTNKNPTGAWDNLPCSLFLVIINEGVFTISSVGSAQHQLGVLSKQDIIDSMGDPRINYREVQVVNGGDFSSSLMKMGSRIHKMKKDKAMKGGCEQGGIAVSLQSPTGGAMLKRKNLKTLDARCK